MAEYIKKDDVLEYMRSRLDMQDSYLPIHFMDLVIDEMPAADVRENVKGEWIECEENKNVWFPMFRCSKCLGMNAGASNFCPNCGADMRKTCDDQERLNNERLDRE